MGVMAGTPRTTAGRALALGGVTVVCGVLAVALGTRVAALVAVAGTARADELVELAVLGAGALVVAWLALSAAVASACLVVRSAGFAWRRGESWVHRFAPAVVRQAMVVVVATGLGAASVTAASAAAPAPTTSPAPVATVVADGVALDLGWVADDAPAPVSSGGPASPAPGTDLGWALTGGTSTPVPSGDGRALPTPTSTSTGAPVDDVPTGHADVPTPVAAVSGSATPTDAPNAARTSTPAWAPPSAAPTTAPSPAVTTIGDVAPDALPVPHGRPSASAPHVTADGATVVVHRGDTLWDIAARHLPAGAGDAQVAAAWPAWYAANAATIGPDPDRILPGQVLVVPVAVAR